MVGRGSRILRNIDRFVGIPIVILLGSCSRKRPLPATLNRIGILHTAAIGDTVLASAILRDLRDAYRAARIVFFAGRSNAAVVKLIDGPDEIVELPLSDPLAAIRTIRFHQLDLLVDLGPWPRLNAVLAWAANSAFTVGFRTAGQFRHYAYDVAVEHSRLRHELDNYRALLESLGIGSRNSPAMKFSPANEIHEVEGCEPFVVFHPWAGGFKGHLREWQNEKWSMLAREMIGLGYHVVLTGAREEVKKNEEIVNTESPNSRGWMVNAAGLSLRRSLEMVRRASLVVSVNTGIMHVAAAIGAPLVALHGPTSIVRWGPIDENAINIVPSVPGHGYLNLGFEYPRHPPPCMEHIEYSRVRDACCEKLAAQGRVRPQSESCADVG